MTNSGLQGSAKTYDTKNWTVDVPCGPLTSVLQNVFGTIHPISFLSLDVEGAESMVLNVLDLNTVTIDVIMIEIMNTHCPKGNCPNTHTRSGNTWPNLANMICSLALLRQVMCMLG